jgi:CBS domain-containing protein
MTDFLSDPPLTVAEDCTLSAALDEMFRSGVRAFLVARELTVVGLVTAEDMHGTAAQCVAECMTPASQMPAIDWQTMLASRVADLLEIFAGASVGHLVVLDSEPGEGPRPGPSQPRRAPAASGRGYVLDLSSNDNRYASVAFGHTRDAAGRR